MSQDTQYTALGPAIVGFQSDGSEIEQGVNVQGNNVGVYAELLAQSPGTRSSPASTGVFGTGDAFGVYAAAGDLVASVNGDASQLPAFLDVANSIAVVGAGLSTPGIIGISDKARPPRRSRWIRLGLSGSALGAPVWWESATMRTPSLCRPKMRPV